MRDEQNIQVSSHMSYSRLFDCHNHFDEMVESRSVPNVKSNPITQIREREKGEEKVVKCTTMYDRMAILGKRDRG